MEQTLGVLSQLALVAFPFLLGIVVWSVQENYKAFQARLDEEVRNREQLARDSSASLAREAGQRAIEVAELERRLGEANEKLIALQREVDKEYVNFERLEQIIRPLRDSLDGLRTTVIEGQREIFNKLDTKQDRVK